MKSCLGLLISLLILLAVIATIGGIWYLTQTTEFSRKDAPASAPAPMEIPTGDR